MANFRYLLDTNIASQLIKNPQGAVAERMQKSGLEKYCVPALS
jgi:tRNA(fMet)-specific endonuclease VapC